MKRLMDSIGLLFEVGEKSFIEAIRNYESVLSDDLQNKMRSFYKDEARHTSWHREYSKLLGVDIKEINEETKETLKKYGGSSAKDSLKTTLVLEAITKAGAHFLLKTGKLMVHDIPEPMQSQWIQHAREEANHVPHVYEAGKYLGVTNKELISHSPKVVFGLLKQTYNNYKRLK